MVVDSITFDSANNPIDNLNEKADWKNIGAISEDSYYTDSPKKAGSYMIDSFIQNQQENYTAVFDFMFTLAFWAKMPTDRNDNNKIIMMFNNNSYIELKLDIDVTQYHHYSIVRDETYNVVIRIDGKTIHQTNNTATLNFLDNSFLFIGDINSTSDVVMDDFILIDTAMWRQDFDASALKSVVETDPYKDQVFVEENNVAWGYTYEEPKLYSVGFTYSSSSGMRSNDAANLSFTRATPTSAGTDDFKELPPFNIRQCLTKQENGQRRVYSYKGSSDYQTLENTKEYDVMIEFPCFWYQRPSELSWSISSEPAAGFQPSPMHFRNGKLYKYTYISKYMLDSTFKSLPNVAPLGNKTIQEHRDALRAKGQYVWDYATICSLQMLALVKYANTETQNTIGRGHSDTSAAKGYQNTGLSDTVLGWDGGIANIGTDGSIVCFGIDALWGNMFSLVDGILRYNNHYYINTDIENITAWPSEDSIKNNNNPDWKQVPTEAVVWESLANIGYVDTLAYDELFPWANFPKTVVDGGSVTTPASYNTPKGIFGDMAWPGLANNTLTIQLLFGNRVSGFGSGLFAWIDRFDDIDLFSEDTGVHSIEFSKETVY